MVFQWRWRMWRRASFFKNSQESTLLEYIKNHVLKNCDFLLTYWSSRCGRKKRSVIEPQLRTQEDSPCPQSAWKEVIDSNIGNDIESSKYAIQGALFKTFESKFLITCTKVEDKHHLQFVTNGEGYCSSGNNKIWCAAMTLLA